MNEPQWEVSVGIGKQTVYYALEANLQSDLRSNIIKMKMPDDRTIILFTGNAVVEAKQLKSGEYTAMINKQQIAEVKQQTKQNGTKTIDWDNVK